ncbi:MAG TPA: outer membrane protein assembly factor BamE [Gammaproteobacteria bacterium]|nr:outer membrane protein assembly factor BamE [Gammaproteobacteria bacterium]
MLAGCQRPDLPDLRNIPFAYRVDVQQGNVITQEMLAQLEPGMDKKKVNFIMGSPAITDTFHSNRWDYVYTFQPGHKNAEMRRVTLFFADDKLVRVEGGVKPAAGPIEVDMRQDQSVEVPGQKRGVLRKMADALPFVGDGTTKAGAEAEDDEEKEKVPEVVVPADAPVKKKKSFFARIFGRDEDGDDEDTSSAH